MKIHYGYMQRKHYPIFCLSFIIVSIFVIYNKWPYASVLDFEGFDSSIITNIFFILGIVYWFYLRSRYHILTIEGEGFRVIGKDNIFVPFSEITYIEKSRTKLSIYTNNSRYRLLVGNIYNLPKLEKFLKEGYGIKWHEVPREKWKTGLYFVLFLVLLTGFIGITFEAFNIKYYLPLKKIETTQIEVTLKQDAKVSYYDYGNRLSNKYFSLNRDSEYPEIYFHYNVGVKGLQEKFCNLEFVEEESWTKQDRDSKAFRHIIEKGTKVKIRVRQNQLDDALALTKEDLTDKEKRKKNSVRIYELAIGDNILLQKHGLKL